MNPYSAETNLDIKAKLLKRFEMTRPYDNDRIDSAVKECTFYATNKIYVKEGFFNNGFKNAATDVYQTAVENVNLIENIQTADIMNCWVESQINDKIMNLITGSKKAFNDIETDLSGIAGDKGDIVISDALRKTYIDVEEADVEAAAY
ncbi:Serpin domain containing protein, partial [Asbolus verrucosus]